MSRDAREMYIERLRKQILEALEKARRTGVIGKVPFHLFIMEDGEGDDQQMVEMLAEFVKEYQEIFDFTVTLISSAGKKDYENKDKLLKRHNDRKALFQGATVSERSRAILQTNFVDSFGEHLENLINIFSADNPPDFLCISSAIPELAALLTDPRIRNNPKAKKWIAAFYDGQANTSWSYKSTFISDRHLKAVTDYIEFNSKELEAILKRKSMAGIFGKGKVPSLDEIKRLLEAKHTDIRKYMEKHEGCSLDDAINECCDKKDPVIKSLQFVIYESMRNQFGGAYSHDLSRIPLWAFGSEPKLAKKKKGLAKRLKAYRAVEESGQQPDDVVIELMIKLHEKKITKDPGKAWKSFKPKSEQAINNILNNFINTLVHDGAQNPFSETFTAKFRELFLPIDIGNESLQDKFKRLCRAIYDTQQYCLMLQDSVEDYEACIQRFRETVLPLLKEPLLNLTPDDNRKNLDMLFSVMECGGIDSIHCDHLVAITFAEEVARITQRAKLPVMTRFEEPAQVVGLNKQGYAAYGHQAQSHRTAYLQYPAKPKEPVEPLRDEFNTDEEYHAALEKYHAAVRKFPQKVKDYEQKCLAISKRIPGTIHLVFNDNGERDFTGLDIYNAYSVPDSTDPIQYDAYYEMLRHHQDPRNGFTEAYRIEINRLVAHLIDTVKADNMIDALKELEASLAKIKNHQGRYDAIFEDMKALFSERYMLAKQAEALSGHAEDIKIEQLRIQRQEGIGPYINDLKHIQFHQGKGWQISYGQILFTAKVTDDVQQDLHAFINQQLKKQAWFKQTDKPADARSDADSVPDYGIDTKFLGGAGENQAVDVLLFIQTPNGLKLLTIKRADGQRALPGGFVEGQAFASCARELLEECFSAKLFEEGTDSLNKMNDRQRINEQDFDFIEKILIKHGVKLSSNLKKADLKTVIRESIKAIKASTLTDTKKAQVLAEVKVELYKKFLPEQYRNFLNFVSSKLTLRKRVVNKSDPRNTNAAWMTTQVAGGVTSKDELEAIQGECALVYGAGDDAQDVALTDVKRFCTQLSTTYSGHVALVHQEMAEQIKVDGFKDKEDVQALLHEIETATPTTAEDRSKQAFQFKAQAKLAMIIHRLEAYIAKRSRKGLVTQHKDLYFSDDITKDRKKHAQGLLTVLKEMQKNDVDLEELCHLLEVAKEKNAHISQSHKEKEGWWKRQFRRILNAVRRQFGDKDAVEERSTLQVILNEETEDTWRLIQEKRVDPQDGLPWIFSRLGATELKNSPGAQASVEVEPEASLRRVNQYFRRKPDERVQRQHAFHQQPPAASTHAALLTVLGSQSIDHPEQSTAGFIKRQESWAEPASKQEELLEGKKREQDYSDHVDAYKRLIQEKLQKDGSSVTFVLTQLQRDFCLHGGSDVYLLKHTEALVENMALLDAIQELIDKDPNYAERIHVIQGMTYNSVENPGKPMHCINLRSCTGKDLCKPIDTRLAYLHKDNQVLPCTRIEETLTERCLPSPQEGHEFIFTGVGAKELASACAKGQLDQSVSVLKESSSPCQVHGVEYADASVKEVSIERHLQEVKEQQQEEYAPDSSIVSPPQVM